MIGERFVARSLLLKMLQPAFQSASSSLHELQGSSFKLQVPRTQISISQHTAHSVRTHPTLQIQFSKKGESHNEITPAFLGMRPQGLVPNRRLSEVRRTSFAVLRFQDCLQKSLSAPSPALPARSHLSISRALCESVKH